MYDSQRAGDLLHVTQSFPLLETGLHTGLQITSQEILHREVFEAGMYAVIVDLHDERIADGDDRCVLALEELTTGRIVTERLAYLERHVAAE